jgi:predicted DNA-binding transcriptional regulator AlpA
VKELTGKSIGLKTVKGQLLTTKEIAEFLRVSERWVQAHMKQGTFPIRWFPVGVRDRVVDSADLEEWLSKIWINAGTAQLPLKAERKLRNGGVNVAMRNSREPVL